MFPSKRALITFLTFAILCIGSAAIARAEIVIAGSTTGCFGANCTPTQQPPSLLNLTFTGGCFGCATDTGLDHVGKFTLGSLPANYNGQTFTLLVNFLGPTFPNPTTFTAMLTGGVDASGDGSLLIHFIDSPQTFFTIDYGLCIRCSNSPASIRYYFNDVIISPGQSVNLTARAVVIPEPTTLFLLGTGLAGLAARQRRRRLSNK